MEDLDTCDVRLHALEVALDRDESSAANSAALALAIAGGYPSMKGPDLLAYRARAEAQGGDAYNEIDRKPWRWLSAVASSALEHGDAGKLLAARVAHAAWVWRAVWGERYANEISRSVSLGIQFQEEIGLIPPPDRLYGPVIDTGITALRTLEDGNQVIRRYWGTGETQYPAQGVLRLLSKSLAELHGNGVEFTPFARATAFQALGIDDQG